MTARTLILPAKRLPCGHFPKWRFHGHDTVFADGNPCTLSQRRQAVNMDLSNATAWFATTAMRLHRLWCPFGEVQQDLLLSCLTIG